MNEQFPVSFVSLNESTAEMVEYMHHEAYPEGLTAWNHEALMDDIFVERDIGRYSFLLHGSTWIGHSLAYVIDGDDGALYGEPSLYVADMVVRPHLQGRGYARIMAVELLKRAHEGNIRHIEMHAREQTSYRAIKSSKYTEQVLTELGYIKTEHSREQLRSDNVDEYGWHISLKKIENAL